MTLRINGAAREFEAGPYTVATLLDELGLAGKPVVVELNLDAVLPADYAMTSVPSSSSLEIVTIAAGG